MLPYIFTVPTIYFVNIYLKLEIPINVQHYFDLSNVRGEGNSVVCINREIFLGPEDARICFTLLKMLGLYLLGQNCLHLTC